MKYKYIYIYNLLHVDLIKNRPLEKKTGYVANKQPIRMFAGMLLTIKVGLIIHKQIISPGGRSEVDPSRVKVRKLE